MEHDLEWAEEREIRQRVRRRLQVTREVLTYVVVVGFLALLDWATGGGWWVQWVAIIWGGFIAWRIFGEIGGSIWGRDAEERMVRREMERRGR